MADLAASRRSRARDPRFSRAAPAGRRLRARQGRHAGPISSSPASRRRRALARPRAGDRARPGRGRRRRPHARVPPGLRRLRRAAVRVPGARRADPRRAAGAAARSAEVIDAPPVRIDTRTREVTRAGWRVQLAQKEYELLLRLAPEPDGYSPRRSCCATSGATGWWGGRARSTRTPRGCVASCGSWSRRWRSSTTCGASATG